MDTRWATAGATTVHRWNFARGHFMDGVQGIRYDGWETVRYTGTPGVP